MDIEKDARMNFVRQGLSRYAEARETVNYFQACLFEVMAEALHAKAWQNFTPDGQADSRELLKSSGGTYLSYSINGTLGRNGRRASLALGVYWDPPQGGVKVALSACCWWEGMGGLVELRETTRPNISLRPLYKKNERRLVMELSPDTDLEQAMCDMLEALDESLPTGTAASPLS